MAPAETFNAPLSVPPPFRLSVPAWTDTVPVLLKAVLIVEVEALPDFVHVPALFTAALAPVSPEPWLLAEMERPELVVSSLKVAPLATVSIPEPGSVPPFRSIASE